MDLKPLSCLGFHPSADDPTAGKDERVRARAVDDRKFEIAVERGDDPMTWLSEGRRTTFTPGLIDDDFRFTSRPTFQQVIEFAPGG